MAAQRAHLWRSSCLVAACTFALSSFIATTPARAQFGLETFLHQLFFGNGNTHHRPHHAHRHRPAGDSDEDDSVSSAFPDDEEMRELAKLAPPAHEQLALLKNVNASDSLGAVGSSDTEVGSATAIDEADRDYTIMVDQLMQTLKSKLSASGHQGDVTETAVLDALTEAILQAKLERFETFIGENWSAERLRGMIIKRVTDEIGGLFEGNNRGAVSMADLNSMIKKSAREVYARLFETSELLAANRSATLFMQRLYQARGDLVKGDVREDTEELLQKASSEGIAHFQYVFSRADHPYTLIYRTQRIIFDCLSDNVESIAGSGGGAAAIAEIETRLIETERKQCTKWVVNQMLGVDGGVRPQIPLPLRVIWTADGPKEDPSMYGHASDQS
ncbi:MAG: hypothetical protein P4L68_05175 [Methylovirgula sp.]|nr:hypothetical protein [Methylovirgula sp.]